MRDYEEKRHFHRMQIDCQVTVRPADGSPTLAAEGRDLSGQGFSFYAGQPFDQGALLEVTISPENSLVRPLRAEVEVVRVEPEGEGCLVGTRIRRMLD
jgi:hypothetical protein